MKKTLKEVVEEVYNRQHKVFNGRNFAQEVNYERKKMLEWDTIKRVMRQLKQDHKIDYRWEKGGKKDHYSGLYHKIEVKGFEKYFYRISNATLLERCSIQELSIGGRYCKFICKHNKGISVDGTGWIKCERLNEALNKK